MAQGISEARTRCPEELPSTPSIFRVQASDYGRQAGSERQFAFRSMQGVRRKVRQQQAAWFHDPTGVFPTDPEGPFPLPQISIVVLFCTLMSHARSDLSPLKSGWDDGARTRDFCRDRLQVL